MIIEMRLFRLLPALSLLGAFASPYDLREPAPYTLDPRGPADKCANINLDLTQVGVPASVGKFGESILILKLMPSDVSETSTDICLCLSQVVDFVKNNAIALMAVAIAGEPAIEKIVTDLVC